MVSDTSLLEHEVPVATRSSSLSGTRQSGNIRVAILSTPRSGNTWLRYLVSTIYDVTSIAMHSPADVDWANLPDRCVLQMHWHRLPSFYERLQNNGFQIVVLARHPIDILISILHFAIHEPTSRWLEGEEGNEHSIYGAMPRSAPFLEYATGRRAAALLSVTSEWWTEPDVLQVHYESLALDPHSVLKFLVDTLGGKPRRTVAEVVESGTIPRLRRLTQCDRHFWQGRPGHWRTLLTQPEADAIRVTHSRIFDELGYNSDADPSLTPAQADANWVRLAWGGLVDDLQDLRIVKREYANLEVKHKSAREEVDELKEVYRSAVSTVEALQGELVKAQNFIAQCEGLGPQTLRLARRLKKFADRHPRAMTFLRSIIKGPRTE
jgi:hypothetical protein